MTARAKRVASGYHWTDGEKRTLREMRAAGATYREIAERLGRRGAEVRSAATRMNLPRVYGRRFWTSKERAFLLENYHVLGRKECARRLGRTRNEVANAARRFGCDLDRRYCEAERKRVEVIDLLGKGVPPCRVADHLGVSRGNVYHIIRWFKDRGLIASGGRVTGRGQGSVYQYAIDPSWSKKGG